MLATRRQDGRTGPTGIVKAQPVAAVLADGTVVPLTPEIRTRIDVDRDDWAEGMVSGRGWTLWWQRRE